ncbi:hypothetical protein H4582DRAFT_60967 [Lactarius indigo]|nr:hypothetical protein H4582DRAFT_60967 [Lactarius indigo]
MHEAVRRNRISTRRTDKARRGHAEGGSARSKYHELRQRIILGHQTSVRGLQPHGCPPRPQLHTLGTSAKHPGSSSVQLQPSPVSTSSTPQTRGRARGLEHRGVLHALCKTSPALAGGEEEGEWVGRGLKDRQRARSRTLMCKLSTKRVVCRIECQWEWKWRQRSVNHRTRRAILPSRSDDKPTLSELKHAVVRSFQQSEDGN